MEQYKTKSIAFIEEIMAVFVVKILKL